jgi:cytochrome b involved in lipid metabolism
MSEQAATDESPSATSIISISDNPSSTNSTNGTIATSSDRVMNDTTMPPPPPKLLQVSNTSSRKPAVNPKERGPKKGFGLYDWKRLLTSATDLAQRKGQPLRRDIPLDEIKLHNKPHDAWIILRDRVYNIGPYLHYHPGGVGIFKNVLGKDATVLFDKFHRWVNIDGLVGPLFLGMAELPPRQEESLSYSLPKSILLTSNKGALRVLAKKAGTHGALLLPRPDDENSDEEDQILPPPPPSTK